MASYKLVVDRRVRKKDLPGLPKPEALKVARRIGKLASEPRPPGTEKLTNQPGYRLRQGKYRILYVIDDNRKRVTIVGVLHRREAYQKDRIRRSRQ
ncbi:MAG: type II toxin-antitoxin system RelE/ParE family toxin [bacterium]|nr:type II toxin-antitoxin system RelE/ParE family toxin [bacterium]MDZ4247756.1 type II toxin-antitoxin system RelE/ParE family toxin [Patescibacteria group bacterium]